MLFGPGMQDEESTCELVVRALSTLRATSVILDAIAMGAIERVTGLLLPMLLTPHAGEMAHLLDIARDTVNHDPLPIACKAAAHWNAAVALKGAATFIALPDGRAWCHEGGNVGLVEVTLAPDSPVVDHAIKDLEIPRDATIVAVVRSEHVVMPRGDTIFEAGDEVLAMVTHDSEEDVRKILTGG